MKERQPLTDMRDRWVWSTPEAFDALKKLGYTSSVKYHNRSILEVVQMSDCRGVRMYQDTKTTLEPTSKQAYFYNNNFYDEPQDDFTITEDKVPFPGMDEILLDTEGYLRINMPEFIKEMLLEMDRYNYIERIPVESQYRISKLAYENGIDVTWESKQTDPHAELKAKYEEALKVYDVVKILGIDPRSKVTHIYDISLHGSETFFNTHHNFYLKCYNIDWNKLLESSYRNGEFVECEFSESRDFMHCELGLLTRFYRGGFSMYLASNIFGYCRIAPNVIIKDSWLVEVKQ